MRRHFFNDEGEGFFKTQDRKGPVKNPISGVIFFFFIIFMTVLYEEVNLVKSIIINKSPL